MSERTGTTDIDRISLRPGLNTLMAVMLRRDAPANPDTRKVMVASALAAAFDSPAEYIGRDPTGITQSLVYLIGYGRPVYINEVERTAKWDAWYQKLGAPIGPDVHYLPVNIDWRGPTSTVTTPRTAVAFPNGTSPAVISNNWPDGNREQQIAYLNSAATNAAASGFYGHVSAGLKEVDKFVGSAMTGNIGTYLVWGTLILGGGYLASKYLDVASRRQAGRVVK